MAEKFHIYTLPGQNKCQRKVLRMVCWASSRKTNNKNNIKQRILKCGITGIRVRTLQHIITTWEGSAEPSIVEEMWSVKNHDWRSLGKAPLVEVAKSIISTHELANTLCTIIKVKGCLFSPGSILFDKNNTIG